MTRILVILFALIASFTASAQVVQPSSIRQAKGATIVAITAANSTTESAIYDMAAYNGLSIFVTSANQNPCYAFINVLGAGEKTGPFLYSYFDSQASYFVDTRVHPVQTSYTIANLPPYVKIQFYVSPPGSCNAGVTIKITPIPITNKQIVTGQEEQFSASSLNWPILSGGLTKNGAIAGLNITDRQDLFVKPGGMPNTGYYYAADTSPISVPTGAATLVYYATPGDFPVVQIQNVGTPDVVCGFLDTTSTSQYAFKLYAKTAAYPPTTRDVYGLGNFAYHPEEGVIYREQLFCTSATAATGSVAITAY